MSHSEFQVEAGALEHLGFNEVVRLLRGLCPSAFGVLALESDVFPATRAALQVRFLEAMEAKDAVLRLVAPPFSELRDVRPHVAAAQKRVVLPAPDLIEAARTIDAVARVRDVIGGHTAEWPHLAERARLLSDERRFARRVLGAFDETGQMKDDASPELASLRARLRSLKNEAQEQLQRLVKTLDTSGYLRDRNFTVRNGRYVVPVRSEVQSLVEGIVHDASQTHQTVFMEPRALVEIGNRIKMATAEALEEEERVLVAFGEELAERGADLLADLALCGEIEASFARGRYAAVAQAHMPQLVEGDGLALYTARHPLLAYVRGLEPDAKPVIDNDIAFSNARVLVVSGPNGGGKTVALTTTGLIALMVRAGIPAPVAPESKVPLYARVLCAMAGDQSLQAGLSTFQWHLTELHTLIARAQVPKNDDGTQPASLCLIDEICSGTDPAEGAALAQAVLEDVAQHAHVVVTTHFERLKILAHTAPDVFRNASFALSERTGQPTYRLLLDQAGTSRALSAAKDRGLPESVLQRATTLMSKDDVQLSTALRTLQEQADTLRAKLDDVESERQTLLTEREKLHKRLDQVERESERLRKEGKRAFLDEIKVARALVAEAIEAKKSGADGAKLNALSHNLKQLEDDTHKSIADKTSTMAEALMPTAIKVGDAVELADMPGNRFTIVEIDGDDVVVAKGALKTRTTRQKLRAPDKASKLPKAGKSKKAATSASDHIEPRTRDNSLDVRGMRADEAVDRVEVFLDRMLKEDRSRAFILHGHGGGSLKGAIRKALAHSPYVKRHAPGDLDEGGDGWTVVTLST